MDLTHDDFLSGRIRAVQAKHGFRAGIDTVLLAAAVNIGSTDIAELGAGSGIASCCLLADLPDSKATLVDFDAISLSLARQNLDANGFATRAKTTLLDVTQKGSIRVDAGLRLDFYSTIIANPPFFDADAGTISSKAGRAGSRHMQNEDLDKWVKCAASSAVANGEVIFIHSITALPRLLASFDARFGSITILPICSRPQQKASRFLIRGIKGSRAPMTMLPPLVLHGGEGNGYLPQADAIFRGKKRLSWQT